MFLAGDLGGTKTLLGEFARDGTGLTAVRRHEFSSGAYPSFGRMLHEFLKDRVGAPIEAACFGIAGTVIHGRSHATNLPWSLVESELQSDAGIPRVRLINDLAATALGMLTLPASEIAPLNPHATPTREGNIAVLAAGTGMGEATLYWDGGHHYPIASEGGHADFAPRNDREAELWNYLRHTYGGHVSYERVLSGPGFLNIYNFLKTNGSEEPAWLADEIKAGEPHAVITAHGLKGDVPICAETVELFASAYGAEAGNAALRCVAVGGVFIGGGIAPKILPALRSSHFLDSFTAKGRFSEFLKGVEVSVCLNPQAALLGAAHYASRA